MGVKNISMDTNTPITTHMGVLYMVTVLLYYYTQINLIYFFRVL